MALHISDSSCWYRACSTSPLVWWRLHSKNSTFKHQRANWRSQWISRRISVSSQVSQVSRPGTSVDSAYTRLVRLVRRARIGWIASPGEFHHRPERLHWLHSYVAICISDGNYNATLLQYIYNIYITSLSSVVRNYIQKSSAAIFRWS